MLKLAWSFETVATGCLKFLGRAWLHVTMFNFLTLPFSQGVSLPTWLPRGKSLLHAMHRAPSGLPSHLSPHGTWLLEFCWMERPSLLQHGRANPVGRSSTSALPAHCPAPGMFSPAPHLGVPLVLPDPAATTSGLIEHLDHLSYPSANNGKEKNPFPLISVKTIKSFFINCSMAQEGKR